MLVDDSVRSFITRLGAADPVPGGGAASALAGALAAGLFLMTVRITREKEDDKRELLASSEERLSALEQQLTALVDRDAEAYQRVRHAYGMPKDAEDQRIKRAMEIQLANRGATAVPLEVAERCVDMLDAAVEIVRLGRASCISDAGVGNLLALSALTGALLNVQVNLQGIDDDEYVVPTGARAAELTERAHERFEQIRLTVAERMAP